MKNNRTDGFTLIEMLVVVIIVGVLASIAAPGWLTFINRQRIRAVRDEMLQIIQVAQSDTQRTSNGYEVHISSTVGLAALTVSKDITPGASDITTGRENSLGTEVIKSKLKLEAKDVNGVDVDALVFDHQGQISYVSAPSIATEGTLPVAIYVQLDGLNVSNSCIVVTTLLGSMVTAEGDDCDNLDYTPVP